MDPFDLIEGNQTILDAALTAGHQELLWKEVALQLAALHPEDDLEAIKKAVKEKFRL